MDKALQILDKNNVKLVGMSSECIVDGNQKLTLGLIWSIILKFQVGHLKSGMADLHQSNLEKTLLAWCQQQANGYAAVDIKNFTTSWADGLAFNALLHRWKPQMFSYEALQRQHPMVRLDHAFDLAQRHLGIERLLDPEGRVEMIAFIAITSDSPSFHSFPDVNTASPDKKSILMYVLCLFQSLSHEKLSLPEQSSGPRPVSVALGGYQTDLEEVLTWLLEAEDRLSFPFERFTDLPTVKKNFQEFNDFLHELAKHQEDVAAVLVEGADMLAGGDLTKEEENEVRLQLSLLESRWEQLRVSAMERQAKINDHFMKTQLRQLEEFRRWLTKVEERIAMIASLEPNSKEKRLDNILRLQEEVQSHQPVVESIKDLVIVVDDSGSDKGLYKKY